MLKLLIERAYKIIDRDKDVYQVRILVTNNTDRIGYEIEVSNQYIDIIKIDLEKGEIIDEVTSDEFENNLKHFKNIMIFRYKRRIKRWYCGRREVYGRI